MIDKYCNKIATKKHYKVKHFKALQMHVGKKEWHQCGKYNAKSRLTKFTTWRFWESLDELDDRKFECDMS